MKLELLCSILLFAGLALSSEKKRPKLPKAVIQTCSCSLDKYSELKEFLENDLSEYGDLLQVKYEKNAVPKISLLDQAGNENGVIQIANFSRKQIRMVLKEVGIEPFFPLEEEFTPSNEI